MLGASGSTATVHQLEGHPDVVAKVFHKDGVSPEDRNKEIDHLKSVGEYHGHTELPTEGGHHVVLATMKTGVTLHNTEAWKNANATGKKALVLKAQQLTNERNTFHANTHNLVHTCVRFMFPLIAISHFQIKRYTPPQCPLPRERERPPLCPLC